MDRLSISAALARSPEARTCRAEVAPPPRTAPPRPDGRASLSPDPGSLPPHGSSLPFPRRGSLRQLLRPRANAVIPSGARAAAFALAALAALALGLPGEAQAQTVTTFITNDGQAGVTSSITARATAFITGGNTAGYELTSVDIRTGTSLVSLTPQVEIFQNGATDRPETRLVTLTNPGTITDGSFNTFTDSANTLLSANTVYWLLVSNDAAANGSGLRVSTTTNATADSGAAMGWSIGNALWQSDVRNPPWSTTVLRIIFAVKGTPAIAGAACEANSTRISSSSSVKPEVTKSRGTPVSSKVAMAPTLAPRRVRQARSAGIAHRRRPAPAGAESVCRGQARDRPGRVDSSGKVAQFVQNSLNSYRFTAFINT